MRCGKCKDEHDTVAEVRSCFGAPSSAPAVRQPSAGQRSLAQALAKERQTPEQFSGEGLEALHKRIETMGLGEIREFIDLMLEQPHVKEDLTALFGQIENGRYALETDEGDIRFYRVSGRDMRRLYELTGAPGDFRERHIYRPAKVLKRIAADPVVALARFGQNVGTCGRCGSPLTKKHTRERGIGDDCYAKVQGGA